MQGALDMRDAFPEGRGWTGSGRLVWFIGLSLAFHVLLGFWLYHLKPSEPNINKPEPVIVRLLPLPEAVLPAPPALTRSIPRIQSDKVPDVIDAPETPAGARAQAPSPAVPPLPAAPDEPLLADGPGLVTRRPAIERLFDPGVIAEQARGLGPLEEPEGGITFDTREMMLTGYMGLLRDKIESTWAYPRKAAEEGVYGDLIIRFSIRRDGKLGSAKVLRTSGHALLDEAALKALKDAGPYWPLPEAYRDETLVITGRFIYSLYGMYVR